MNCPKCKAALSNDSTFCTVCGAAVEKSSSVPPPKNECSTSSGVQGHDPKLDKIFLEKDERFVTNIGSAASFNNFMGLGLQKDSCFVSDRRLYFKGRVQKGVYTSKSENIVDLKDITGTGFVNLFNWIWLILSVIMGYVTYKMYDNGAEEVLLYICAGFCLLFLLLFFLRRKKAFSICFAGGEITVLLGSHSQSEIRAFHKSLRLAIDDYYRRNKF